MGLGFNQIQPPWLALAFREHSMKSMQIHKEVIIHALEKHPEDLRVYFPGSAFKSVRDAIEALQHHPGEWIVDGILSVHDKDTFRPMCILEPPAQDRVKAFERRHPIMGNGVERYLKGKMDEIATSRAVQHPFLEWYAHNPLTKQQERILFSECFYWFRHLPFYIASMSTLTRDPKIFREIIFNLADEMCGERTHAEIYLDFLERIDIKQEEVLAYRPSFETSALNSGMERLYGNTPIEKALGALYFDEVMSAIMVEKVAMGLLNQGYDAAVIRFWTLHIELEKGHSNSVNKAIFPYAGEVRTKILFEEGLYELMALVEGFWDGIDEMIREEARVRRKDLGARRADVDYLWPGV